MRPRSFRLLPIENIAPRQPESFCRDAIFGPRKLAGIVPPNHRCIMRGRAEKFSQFCVFGKDSPPPEGRSDRGGISSDAAVLALVSRGSMGKAGVLDPENVAPEFFLRIAGDRRSASSPLQPIPDKDGRGRDSRRWPHRKERIATPDENAVSSRRSVVDSPHGADYCPYGKANASSNKHMTWVAVGHPTCRVTAPVVSTLGWFPHPPALPPPLSFGPAIVCGSLVTSLLYVFAACGRNPARL